MTLAVALACAGCMAPPPRSPADVAVRTDCREQVDRQYNAQNRVDLTRRDERDFAFAGSYNSGISSRGLSAEYSREKMIDGCLRAAGGRSAATPGVGPAFSPPSSAGTSSLQP